MRKNFIASSRRQTEDRTKPFIPSVAMHRGGQEHLSTTIAVAEGVREVLARSRT